MSVVGHRLRWIYKRFITIIFGNRIGLTLFLAALVFFTIYWRIGFFITDNYVTANTLVNVANGHLFINHIIYGPQSGSMPGLKIHDSHLYGQNYGLVIVALPFLWGLDALTAFTDLRITLAALWSLLLLALAVQLDALLNREHLFIGGVITALITFILNVILATPLDLYWVPMIALQMSTMVWAALLGVLVYRLIARIYDLRTAVFAGAAVVLASPIGFWASIPKRHVLIAFLTVITFYCFYRSRTTTNREVSFRALSYIFVALTAWVFPLEALLLLLALAPVDLLTSQSNRPRYLLIIGTAFLVALIPFFTTNLLITGNPLLPPGLLSTYTGEDQILSADPNQMSGSMESNGSNNGRMGRQTDATATQFSLITLVLSVADTVGAHIVRLWSRFLGDGIKTIINDPEQVYHTFIRSGYIGHIAEDAGNEAINLALVEVMPLLAVLLASPVTVARTIWTRSSIRKWLASPVGYTDIFIAVYSGLIVLAYLPRSLGQAQVTVRYFLPILPGLVYFIVRQPQIRLATRSNGRILLFSYVIGVFIGGQLLILILLINTLSLGEAVQLHALIGLGLAFLVGTWTIISSISENMPPRIGAVCLGFAGAATTVFILLSGIVYFAYAGHFTLPVMQWLSELLSIV